MSKKNSGNKARKPAASKCRDCGRTARIPRWRFFRAATPRCIACGGSMEYGGSWFGTRSRGS